MKLLPVLLSTTLLMACAPEETIDETVDDLGEAASEINGDPLGGNPSNSLAGVVRVNVAGDTRVRTGLLVANDLVLTSSRWVGAGTSPSSISIANGTTGGNGQVRTGAYVTVNPYLPVAIIQTIQPFTSPGIVTVDPRSAAQLVAGEQAVSCYAYRTDADFRYAAQEVRRTDGAREYIVGPPFGISARLDDWDAGAPCFDAVNQTWVGFALSSPGNFETRVFAASSIAFFVDGMKRVASIRRIQGWPTPFMVQTIAPSGSRMCLDIPWGSPYNHAGLNQYACHGGLNQRWLLDYSHPVGPALINVMTGSCIDVPGGSTTSGQALQMYGCHSGANQGWRSGGNSALPGDLLSPLSSPTQWTPNGQRPTLCMSVRGGASNSSQPIEQATCRNPYVAYQDWYLGYSL